MIENQNFQFLASRLSISFSVYRPELTLLKRDFHLLEVTVWIRERVTTNVRRHLEDSTKFKQLWKSERHWQFRTEFAAVDVDCLSTIESVSGLNWFWRKECLFFSWEIFTGEIHRKSKEKPPQKRGAANQHLEKSAILVEAASSILIIKRKRIKALNRWAISWGRQDWVFEFIRI